MDTLNRISSDACDTEPVQMTQDQTDKIQKDCVKMSSQQQFRKKTRAIERRLQEHILLSILHDETPSYVGFAREIGGLKKRKPGELDTKKNLLKIASKRFSSNLRHQSQSSRMGQTSRIMSFPIQSSSFCVSNGQTNRLDSNFSFFENRLETKDSNNLGCRVLNTCKEASMPIMQFQVKTSKNEDQKSDMPKFQAGRVFKLRNVKHSIDAARRNSQVAPRAKVPDYIGDNIIKNETEVMGTPVDSSNSATLSR